MAVNRMLNCSFVLSFIVVLLSVGCSTAPLDGSQKANTAVVKVAGSADKLLTFDTKLRSLLGVGNGDSDTLSCDSCSDLRGGDTSISTLTYYVARKPVNVFGNFAAAWNDVWEATKFDANETLVITIEADISNPDPVCTGFAQPCYDRPRCPNTGYCSKNSAGECLPKCSL